MKRSNPWGIYDLNGNVWEWCQDFWHENYMNAPSDGSAWLNDNHSISRILRGGSWNDGALECRSAMRNCASGERTFSLGLRVVARVRTS